MTDYAPLYDAHATCHLLVVPVGPIRTRAFRHALSLLQSCSPVGLQDLTPSLGGPAGDVRSEFTAPTFPNGHVCLRFLSEYDDEFSTLEEFHAARRVFGVVGILHCSPGESASDLEHAAAAFTHHTLPKFPSALVSKVLAFAPAEYAPDRAVNLGSNTCWISALPHQRDLALPPLQAAVADMATLLLQGFQDLAAAIQVRSLIHSPPAPAMGSASPLGPDALIPAATTGGGSSPISPLAIGTAALASAMQATTASMMASQEQKLRKRAPGRAAKLVADLLLLAGKLPAAIDKYLEAMEGAKAQSDTLWLAASMDSLYSAMLCLRQVMPLAHDQLPSLPLPVREWLKAAGVSEVLGKFREVVAAYERADAPVLAADVALRVAGMLASAAAAEAGGGGALRVDALALVTQAMANTSATDTLSSPRTQLDLHLRAAALCAHLGYVRKQAMCLTLAVRAMIQVLAQATTARVDPATQYHLMDRLAHLYGLVTLDPMGWPGVQTQVLDVCIQLADAVEDPGALTRLIVKCFQRLQSMLSMDGMLDIVARLQRASKGSGGPPVLAGDKEAKEGAEGISVKEAARQFGFLKDMVLVPPSPDLVVHKRPSTSTTTDKDPFLYSAFSKTPTSATTTILVATEPLAFTVHLTNPFQFAVTLDSLSLLASPDDSTALLADPITLTLPAMATHVAVTLRATPQRPGVLKLLGIAFDIFGVREHCTLAAAAHGGGAPVGSAAAAGVRKQKVTTAVDAIQEPLSASSSRPHSPTTAAAAATAPATCTLDFTVIPALPLLRVRPAGAAHRHRMLLAGQIAHDMHLYLTSAAGAGGGLPVTSLSVQFSEIPVAGAAAAVVDESDPVAVHDADRYDVAHAVMRVHPHAKMPEEIPAGGVAVKVPLEMFGKREREGVEVLVEYGVRGLEYVRRAVAKVAVSVVPSVRVVNVDVRHDAAGAAGVRVGVDVANVYLVPITVRLQTCPDMAGGEQEASASIQPGSTRRLVVRVPQCALGEADLTAPVPEIKAKQFVMTRHGKRPPDFRERVMCFWLREYLVGRMQATWESDDGCRGMLDLTAMRILPGHIPILWEQSIDVRLASVRITDPTLAPHVHEVTLAVKNHAQCPQSFLVQVQPDALALVRLLGHGVATLCEVGALETRKVKWKVLAIGSGREDERETQDDQGSGWTLVCHVTRVASEHSLVHVTRLEVGPVEKA